MRWKQNRAQILQDWEKQVEDFNHNGYLDIAWNVIKGAVATFTDLLQTKKSSPATGRLPKDYAPEWDDDEKYLVSLYNIVSIQEAGATVSCRASFQMDTSKYEKRKNRKTSKNNSSESL